MDPRDGHGVHGGHGAPDGHGGAAPAPPDLRAPALGLAAWVGALVGLLLPGGRTVLALAALGLLVALTTALLARRGSRRGADRGADRGAAVRTAGALLGVAVVACVVATVHRVDAGTGPVADLAAERASVRGELVVTGDPRLRQGRFSDYVVLRGRLDEVTGRGRTHAVAASVLVIAPPAWERVELGSRLAVAGRLAEPDGGDLAAVLQARGDPEVRRAPDAWWDGAAAVRRALRASVAHRPPEQAVLVPSLVVGDDAGLDPALADDFATTGLTHLLAVSGTNLTLIVGFLLVLGRWVGVRGRGQVVVAVLGIVGFALLARTEPSVVRAAAMGTVALIGLGRNGLQRGTRSLGVAVVALLLVQPWLALTAGFALSVLATAGILLLAPAWRDALATWLPRWVAEAVAVPAAAQLACTPLVAGISGEVSLVAVLANVLVAPVVGPATVLGLAGGLVGLVAPPLARVPGTVAAWCVGWVIAVARAGADLPAAAVPWGSSAGAVVLLAALCVAAVPVVPHALRRRRVVAATCAVVGLVVLVRPPTPGWPPGEWVVVACDVGQGDALALRSGPAEAVVVDAGGDAAAVDACLDDLGVRAVPLLVVTHFHDDHAGGVAGVLADRAVGAVDVSPLASPAAGADEVRRLAAARGAAVAVPAHGSVRTVGDVRLEVLWPAPGAVRTDGGDGPGEGEEGDGVNDASLVLLAEVRGVRVLLTGDVEPPAQRRLLRLLEARDGGRGLDVDVLKVPHHGSPHQHLGLLTSVRPEVALVSVGADNTYGHPAPAVLHALEGAGARVLRTDLLGDLAVTLDGAGLATTSRRG
ncbi:ComEC/Rec2 family competence protein [Nocardioides sp. ChNu-153]|uniref:ComEC/Rec2 family competence protein n=1 Tax=unclassified Nocardioides TaxID=2615069 RepID=UPI002406B8FE|nr:MULTISPECIES: ComEC/Rec2 family competence protein [unclassified Nocardioides]MDF9715525.1 ComEC/Rec2 family competence protein [Nocardioides sp. ChNu-99]MDN7120720.1 ComEC/Rec2 family competence protein [Nocardioides sp. ChNu-153]